MTAIPTRGDSRWCELPPRSSQMNDAASGGVRHGIGAAGGVQLVQQRADVEFRGVDRYSKTFCNGLVRCALGQQRQYVEFAGREVETVRLGGARIARDDRNICGLTGGRETQT